MPKGLVIAALLSGIAAAAPASAMGGSIGGGGAACAGGGASGSSSDGAGIGSLADPLGTPAIGVAGDCGGNALLTAAGGAALVAGTVAVLDGGSSNPPLVLPVEEVPDVPTPVGSVPEPSTWAMMILGFGVVGCLLRRERRNRGLALRRNI